MALNAQHFQCNAQRVSQHDDRMDDTADTSRDPRKRDTDGDGPVRDPEKFECIENPKNVPEARRLIITPNYAYTRRVN